jgi:hypothetical protein
MRILMQALTKVWRKSASVVQIKNKEGNKSKLEKKNKKRKINKWYKWEYINLTAV